MVYELNEPWKTYVETLCVLISKHVLKTDILCILSIFFIRYMPPDPIADKSTLIQIMA